MQALYGVIPQYVTYLPRPMSSLHEKRIFPFLNTGLKRGNFTNPEPRIQFGRRISGKRIPEIPTPDRSTTLPVPQERIRPFRTA